MFAFNRLPAVVPTALAACVGGAYAILVLSLTAVFGSSLFGSPASRTAPYLAQAAILVVATLPLYGATPAFRIVARSALVSGSALLAAAFALVWLQPCASGACSDSAWLLEVRPNRPCGYRVSLGGITIAGDDGPPCL